MLGSYMIFLLSALTVVFCLICVYTDIRFRRIRNAHIAFMVLIGVYAQGVYHYVDFTTYKEILTLVLGGAILSFLLYYWGIWAPGDAKLCFACMLLLPPIGTISASTSRITYMPIVLLINVFVPGLCLVIALVLLRTTGRQKINALSSLVNDNAKMLKNSALMIPFMLIIFAVSRQLLNWVLSPILQALELPSYLYYLIYLSLSLLVARKVLAEIQQKMSQKHTVVVAVMSCLIALGLAIFMPISMLLISFGFLLVIGICHTVLTSLLRTAFTDEVSVMDLQEHTIPAEQITRSVDENGGVEYTTSSSEERVSPEDIVLPPTSTGIPSATLAAVKRMCKEGKFEGFSNKITIHRPLRFAPIICFGVILTLFCQGPFYAKVLHLLN